MLAVTVAAGAYPLNLILNHGSTGNRWGDAVIGFLAESGFPRWGGLLAGELYVEMLDKFLILLVMFLIIRGKRLILRKTNPEEEPGEAVPEKDGALKLCFRPFEIISLRLTRPGRKEG